MTIASGSAVRRAYILETAFGTTPATPAFQIIRNTGGGLTTDKKTATSEEIRADGNISDEMLLGLDVTGSLNYEFSYGTYDDLMAAALFGDWASDVLKNGVEAKSFTIEETIDLGASESFSRFVGCMVNSWSFSLGSRAVVSGAFNVMGKSETLGSAIITGATYLPSNDNPISTATANVAELTVAGVSGILVKSVQLEVANNLRIRDTVGSLYSQEFGRNRRDITGTLECYFESNTLYQKVLDHEGGELAFKVGNGAAERYLFELPNIKFGNGQRRTGGNSDDVMVSIPFRALLDAGEACSMKITRGVT